MTNKQELREAAEKAGAEVWCAFIDTKSKTYAVHTPDDDRCGDVVKWPGLDGQQRAAAKARFIAAANPATVLALLDELEVISKSEWKLAGDLTEAQMNNNVLEKKLEAAEKRIAELERKEHHIERQSVIDALATAGESWSDIEEYMQQWDAEHAASRINGEG